MQMTECDDPILVDAHHLHLPSSIHHYSLEFFAFCLSFVLANDKNCDRVEGEFVLVNVNQRTQPPAIISI